WSFTWLPCARLGICFVHEPTAGEGRLLKYSSRFPPRPTFHSNSRGAGGVEMKAFGNRRLARVGRLGTWKTPGFPGFGVIFLCKMAENMAKLGKMMRPFREMFLFSSFRCRSGLASKRFPR